MEESFTEVCFSAMGMKNLTVLGLTFLVYLIYSHFPKATFTAQISSQLYAILFLLILDFLGFNPSQQLISTMQLLIHLSHSPWGVGWDKTSLIIEVELLLLLITHCWLGSDNHPSLIHLVNLFLKTGSPQQVPRPYFALRQNWLSEGFRLFSSPSQNFLFCYLTWWCHQCIEVLPSFTLFQCSLHQSTADGRAVCSPLGLSIPGVLDTPTTERKLWPALCHQRDWEKSISDISCTLPLGCLCLKLLLKFQHVQNSNTQWQGDFIQATIIC